MVGLWVQFVICDMVMGFSEGNDSCAGHLSGRLSAATAQKPSLTTSGP